MNHDKFRETFEDLGFDVSQDEEPPEGEENGVLVAENDSGDEIFWSVIDAPEQWGLCVRPDRLTLDNPTFEWHEVEFRDGAFVIEGVSGTAPAQTGYGRTAFSGDLRVDQSSTQAEECRTYS